MKLFIIEDEHSSKMILEKLLESYFPDIEVVGSAENIVDSIRLLNEIECDFILADIQLGNENVFEIMKSLANISSYNFVITTSHENYALEAISNEVLDYIVKPLTIEKLTLAINKVKRKLSETKHKNEDGSNKKNNRFLGLASIDKIEVISVDSIIYIIAEGKYTRFFLLDGTVKITSKNLGEYEKILSKEDFIRVHNSYIVNMNYVKSIIKTGGYFVELIKNQTLIPVSKRKQEMVLKFLKLKS